ncbi:TPA: hypothetical protein ACRU9O_005198, partial [Escherichia coli]
LSRARPSLERHSPLRRLLSLFFRVPPDRKRKIALVLSGFIHSADKTAMIIATDMPNSLYIMNI